LLAHGDITPSLSRRERANIFQRKKFFKKMLRLSTQSASHGPEQTGVTSDLGLPGKMGPTPSARWSSTLA
jgi:hypothetical protein